MPNHNNELPTNDIFISDQAIPYHALQAIFYKITGKVDRLRENYHGGYTVQAIDIIHLDTYIQQMLKQYNVIGRNVEITHQINDIASQTFIDIEKFKIAEMSSRNTTSVIAYQTEFMIKLPSEIKETQDIIQRYKLTIIIENAEIDENDMDVPSGLRGLAMPPKIEMRLDYVDYTVAVAIKSTIESWINTLTKENENSLARFISKHEEKLQIAVPAITMSAPFLGATILIRYHDYNIKSLFEIFFFCIISLVFFKLVIENFVQKIIRSSIFLKPRMKIYLTLGDKNRVERIKQKRQNLSKIIYVLFGGVFINIFLNLISSWIFTKML